MLDRDKDIRAQAMLKSIWESGLAPVTTETFTQEWVETMFKFSIKLIETYAKLEALQMPVLKDARQHLSDEAVAQDLQPHKTLPPTPVNNWPPKETGIISQAQANRLFAIAKSKGFSKKDVLVYIFDQYGYADEREISWKKYKDIVARYENVGVGA